MKSFSRLARGFTLLFALCAVTSPAALAQGKPPAEPGNGPAAAQRPVGSISVAVIDVQGVIRQSSARKSMQPQVEKLTTAFRTELQRQEDEWRKVNDDLLRQRAILSPEAYEQRRNELQEKFSETQRTLQERKRAIDDAINESVGKIRKVLFDVTKEIAQERSIGIVFSKTGIYLAANRFNISGAALTGLNKRLPSVNVTLPKPKPKPKPKKK